MFKLTSVTKFVGNDKGFEIRESVIMIEGVEGNKIKLPYGTVELDIEQGGWCSNYRVDVTWTVDYNRPDLELYRYETCSSLEEALDWYKKQDLEANN